MRAVKFILKYPCLILAVLTLVTAGCGPVPNPLAPGGVRKLTGGGKLAARSLGPQGTVLTGGFETGVYSFTDANHLTVLLLNGPVDTATQAVTIRMFWKPRAGRTPISSNATNATVNYVIFPEAADAAGIYTGAGFLFPRSDVGNRTFRGDLWDASLVLTDQSDSFQDLLGQAELEGGFKAALDKAALEDALRALNRRVRERLGYARLVRLDPDSPSDPD